MKNDNIASFDTKTAEAFKGAFDAMSKWRDEIASSTERHGEQVFDKLGIAAKAAGWPDSMIEASKSQLMQAAKMQTDMIDHMMRAWQSQMKSPASPGQFIGGLTQGPSAGNFDSVDMTHLALAPANLLVQSMEMWRKNWTDAMALWAIPLQGPGQGSSLGSNQGSSVRPGNQNSGFERRN